MAYNHFKKIFTGEDKYIQEQALHCIPYMVTDDQYNNLQSMPTVDELEEVMFFMNPNSAARPDGMNGKFFQAC